MSTRRDNTAEKKRDNEKYINTRELESECSNIFVKQKQGKLSERVYALHISQKCVCLYLLFPTIRNIVYFDGGEISH